jgi:NitT/TauT family transport system permease protein
MARARLAAFSPNRVMSRTALRLIGLGWAALALALWSSSRVEVLPTPRAVLTAFRRLWMEEGLSRELWTSFSLNLTAIGYTTAISLVLAYLTVVPILRPVGTFISKLRFLGLTGLTFLFTMLVSGGHQLKLWLLVFGMTVFFVTSMCSVVAEVPKDKLDYARTLRMSEWHVVWEVVILGTADQAIEAMRQNAAIGWMMLTVVEGLSRSEGGVGAMLLNQNKHFHLDSVFAIQIAILLIGLSQDYALGLFKRAVCPYAELKLAAR